MGQWISRGILPSDGFRLIVSFIYLWLRTRLLGLKSFPWLSLVNVFGYTENSILSQDYPMISTRQPKLHLVYCRSVIGISAVGRLSYRFHSNPEWPSSATGFTHCCVLQPLRNMQYWEYRFAEPHQHASTADHGHTCEKLAHRSTSVRHCYHVTQTRRSFIWQGRVITLMVTLALIIRTNKHIVKQL